MASTAGGPDARTACNVCRGAKPSKRVPLESTDRIEVVDGSSSSLYGNYAMGGVINIVGARPARRTFELKPQYGNHNSPKFDFIGSDVWDRLGVGVDGSMFDTDGFPIVAPSEKGIIDNNATVTYRNFNVKFDSKLPETIRTDPTQRGPRHRDRA